MRKLMLIGILLSFFVVGVATAGSKKDVVKYEVRVEIVYNALTPDEMGRVIEEIGEDHAGACTVKFNVKKLGDDIGYYTVTSSSGTFYVDGTTINE